MKQAGCTLRVCRGLALAASVWLVAACGGSGETDDGGQTIAATAQDYWVRGTGSKWIYRVTDKRKPFGSPASKTTEDVGEETVAGGLARRFEHSWSAVDGSAKIEYRYFDGREIRVRDPDPSSPMSDYAELPAPLRTGVNRKIAEYTERADFDGDGIVDTMHAELQVLLTLEDRRSVPAGDFRNVLRSRQQFTLNYSLSRRGSSSVLTTYTTWYAPKVGVIRTEYEGPDATAPDDTVIEELSGFSVGTLRAGVVSGRILLDNLGFASPITLFGAQPQYAVGAGRIMIVSRAEDQSIQGAIITTDGAPVWRGTVMQPVAPQFGMLAPTVTFDGTDFRVTAVSMLTTADPSEYRLHGQRVSVNGQLADSAYGKTMDTGYADRTPGLSELRSSAREGKLLLTWVRFDSYANLDGRLFDEHNDSMAPTFHLGAGVARVPGAIAPADGGGFVVVDAGGGLMVNQSISSWLIAPDGNPVSTAPLELVPGTETKRDVKLAMTSGQLWLSYSESGTGNATVFVARLGQDGTLQALPIALRPGAPTGLERIPMAMGAARSLIAWADGANVRGWVFGNGTLTSASQLPSETLPVVPSDGPVSHRMVDALALEGDKFLVAWTDNGLSEKLMFSLIYPRYVVP